MEKSIYNTNTSERNSKIINKKIYSIVLVDYGGMVRRFVPNVSSLRVWRLVINRGIVSTRIIRRASTLKEFRCDPERVCSSAISCPKGNSAACVR